MKFVILACFAAVAIAAPQYNSYAPPSVSTRDDSAEFIPILKDDRVSGDDGAYNFDMETANGIVRSESGSPDGPEDSVVKAGEYSYTAPDGSVIHVTYVADENGFQPRSDVLPVAPEFPHPIPKFVLDQIAFASTEEPQSEESVSLRQESPSPYYQRP